MEPHLSAPKVVTFSVAVVIALIAAIKRTPSGLRRRLPPSRSPSAASQGAMWTIFMEIDCVEWCVYSSTPHTSSRTSMGYRCMYIGEPFTGHPRLDAGARRLRRDRSAAKRA